MNHAYFGVGDPTEHLLAHAPHNFLLIDDGPIADAFLTLPRTRLFDIKKDSVNPLSHVDHRTAREIADVFYTASPQGQETLTVRDGKRAMARLLYAHKGRLDTVASDATDRGTLEALATIDDVLFSPVVRQVLCNQANFSFKGRVVVKLNRAEIGDFDAFILASLLIGQTKGQVIVPDFGFYGRDFYVRYVREQRLTLGVRYLTELSRPLQHLVLSIKDKTPHTTVLEDAELLARYENLTFTPGTNGFGEYVRTAMADNSPRAS